MPAQYTRGLKKIPVTQPLDASQVKNDAGGYVWAVDKWQRARRFLILGNEGGTYYADEQTMSRENAQAILECLSEDPARLVNLIVEVSDGGLAPKNDPALFALALAASPQFTPDTYYALGHLHRVARTATHLFTFLEYVQAFRGWGRGLRNAVADWYAGKPVNALAYQVVKYRQRNGWTHRDLLRLAHLTPNHENAPLLKWVVSGDAETPGLPELVLAFERVQKATRKGEVVKAIQEHGLTREMLPTEWLNDADVWAALLEHMPLTAMIRNLGKMSAVGLLKPLSHAAAHVTGVLANGEALHKARIHPIAVLSALHVYAQGHGERGSLKWTPVDTVVDALDTAFNLAFQNVPATGKRWLLALDVSGSMSSGTIAGVPGLTPRVASAAMALVTARTEPQYHMVGFSHELVPVPITAKTSLNDAVRITNNTRMGGTDCAVPMLYALEHNLSVDVFVVYTDSETWYSKHPAQMLDEYRHQTGIPARLIVVGMTSNGFTIARPGDAGMLDVVGFDSSAPALMSEFALGNV